MPQTRMLPSALMGVDDAFRVAGGARGVVERDRVPFVCGCQLGEIGVALGEEAFVVELAQPFSIGTKRIGDVDDERLSVELRQRAR